MSPGSEHVTLRPGTPDDAALVADIWFDGWHPAHDGHDRRNGTARLDRPDHRVRSRAVRGHRQPLREHGALERNDRFAGTKSGTDRLSDADR